MFFFLFCWLFGVLIIRGNIFPSQLYSCVKFLVLNPTLTWRAIAEEEEEDITTSLSEKWATRSLRNETHVHKRNVEETHNSLIFHAITNVYKTRQVLWFVLLQIAPLTSTRHLAAKRASRHKSNRSHVSAKWLRLEEDRENIVNHVCYILVANEATGASRLWLDTVPCAL
jgi:hypothetical protein